MPGSVGDESMGILSGRLPFFVFTIKGPAWDRVDLRILASGVHEKGGQREKRQRPAHSDRAHRHQGEGVLPGRVGIQPTNNWSNVGCTITAVTVARERENILWARIIPDRPEQLLPGCPLRRCPCRGDRPGRGVARFALSSSIFRRIGKGATRARLGRPGLRLLDVVREVFKAFEPARQRRGTCTPFQFRLPASCVTIRRRQGDS